MRDRIALVAAIALGLALSSCGGGKTAVVGIGNTGNNMGEGLEQAEELAELFIESGAAPAVEDAVLGEIYRSFERQARKGDVQAALVVLAIAAEQREAE